MGTAALYLVNKTALMVCFDVTGSCVSWTTYFDTHSIGGSSRRYVLTPGDCLVLCIDASQCIGVDWTLTDKTAKCFTFDATSGKDPKDNVTHFDIIRDANCTGRYQRLYRP